jgi:hypothetical protein
MNNIIKITPTANKYSDLVIHSNLAKKLRLERKMNANICFGNKKQAVHIKISDETAEENIFVPQKIMSELCLPNYPTYEIIISGNEMIIGPYIGLLLCEEDKKITPSFLNKMLIYAKKYGEINGAIVVFALNKVDTVHFTIEGYCYNPVKNEFQKGVFPYPSAIYRTIGLSEKWKSHFLFAIGDKIFNNYYFSKWEMYEWFSKDKEFSRSIPYTKLYRAADDFFDAMKQYKKIFIKPISGLRGHGIVKASLINNAYLFEYREDGINYKDTLQNIDEAYEFIQKHFYNGRYLIQQAIDLIEYNNSVIDFRCTMQKNQLKNWECKAIIGRCGVKDSIVSNISSGGKAFIGTEIFKNVLFLSEKEALELNNKIAHFATRACNALDEFGIHCGTLGLDVGLDTNGFLWLIEINNRDPDPSIAMDIHDRELYYSLKAGPLFYCKGLSGF